MVNEDTRPRRASADLERRPTLVFLRGELLAAPVVLDRDEVIIGRALDADVRLNDALVSRLHARITMERDEAGGETRYLISDLNSTNGISVNNEQVGEAYLRDGDKLFIGKHVLRFNLFDDIDREFQQQIHRLLVHDELTGLLTSKSFFSELRRETTRAAREGRRLAVLMMDLDHFKQVNDTHGHLVGSQTLAEVGAIIMSTLRAGDVAARFGGEEFAACLLGCDHTQAVVAAERIRREIEEHRFPATRDDSAEIGLRRYHRITISIGVALFPEDSRDPLELVELADGALYRSKNTGRNCVQATQPTPAPNAFYDLGTLHND